MRCLWCLLSKTFDHFGLSTHLDGTSIAHQSEKHKGGGKTVNEGHLQTAGVLERGLKFGGRTCGDGDAYICMDS